MKPNRRAEFLATGSELLGPSRQDGNSLWLASRLARMGFAFSRKAVVGDSPEDITRAVRESLARRPALLVVCGGLGPTQDDLTVAALAKAVGKPLTLHAGALRWTRAFVAALRGRAVPADASMRKQAMLPRGFTPLRNRLGTAPGLWGTNKQTAVIVLPGVPYEFRGLWESEAEPRLRKKFKVGSAIFSRVLHVGEMREPEVDAALRSLFGEYSRAQNGLRLGVTTYPGRTDIHLEAGSPRMLDAAERRIRALLGGAVFGRDGETLESILLALCRKRKIRVAAAESCTGGLLAGHLTREPGSSDYFLGGAVAYTEKHKTKILKVPAALIKKHGVVSEAVAASMAKGARRLFGADAALAVTGYAGPRGGEGKPAGMVCLALNFKGRVSSVTRRFPGGRAEVRERAALAAMHMLRRALLAK